MDCGNNLSVLTTLILISVYFLQPQHLVGSNLRSTSCKLEGLTLLESNDVVVTLMGPSINDPMITILYLPKKYPGNVSQLSD